MNRSPRTTNRVYQLFVNLGDTGGVSALLTVSLWSHALAAILYGALALWQGRHARPTLRQNALVLAFGLTACWALMAALGGGASQGGEGARNLGWLAFMFLLLRQAEDDAGRKLAVSTLYGVVAAVMALDLLIQFTPFAASAEHTSLLLRLMGVIGALVLAHNLYGAAADEGRAAIRLPIVALATMWLFDLNLYTLGLLDLGWAEELARLRGLLLVLLAPLFALAARRNADWRIRLSRKVAFQSLSLLALGAYVLILAGVTVALNALGPGLAQTAQIGFVVVTTVAAAALLPSDRVRAWAKVKLAKHLFQHRYDYRAEWIRFTETIGRADAGPIEERAIKAIADITDSPGGLLLAPDETGALTTVARWNWPGIDAPARAPAAAMPSYEEEPRIVELDAVRAGGERPPEVAGWMLDAPTAWALVPLVHVDRLAGVVLLARPPVDRVLDWEDFDLLRVAGRQLASHLAEARAQEGLSEARRFDEFNRRFAFILHDVKNLCSQLTLLARNAERHADNPEFRADMIVTLQESAGRMNDLLARLSQHSTAKVEPARAIPIGDFVAAIATEKRRLHPIRVGGELELFAFADPVRLEQALIHLLQNAIDASPPEEPVALFVSRHGVDVAIEIVDHGEGMSAEFVRSQLFRPFASSKPGGFGIGAYEARSLVQSMGGRIDVESRVGEGSRFTIVLPQAQATDQDQAA